MRRAIAALLAASFIAAPATSALAWGQSGHRMIGIAAASALPSDLPLFIRGKQAVLDIGDYSREPDRMRSTSKSFDADNSPAHFLDLGDDGTVDGGPSLANLPANRVLYDKALHDVGKDSWSSGYLPYAIMETWQRLELDMATWRMDMAAAKSTKDKAHKAWFLADARRREAFILTNIGFLSHYVGDGSQPLHVTLHFNGWGDFPNPDGFTTDKIHSKFEGDFVVKSVKQADVSGGLTPFDDKACPVKGDCSGFKIETAIPPYLAVTAGQVRPLYQLWKEGAFSGTDPRGKDFVVSRLRYGAQELRDLIVLAWRGSATLAVGYPKPVTLADVESGKVDPYYLLHGAD